MQTATDQLDSGLTPLGMLKAQRRIIVALMLHDIRSRFGGSALGFLMMGVCWPLSHMLIMLVLYSGLGRTAPYGDSVALFFATGLVPFMVFQYVSRFMSLGILLDRSLLSFPTVKVTDILFARALIEVLNAGLVILIIFAIFWTAGIDFMPRDIVQASFALLAMILLGLGFGVLNAIITGAFTFWITGYALCMMIFWVSSGILFVPDALPEFARTPLSYLPWLQGVEWMRSAYYEGYGSTILNKTYLVIFAISSLFVGLVLERLLRGKMLR